MSSGRHSAPRPQRAAVSAFKLRRTVISTSAVVAVAGLSLTGLLPVNAATLVGAQSGQTAATAGAAAAARATHAIPAYEVNAQSYTVPSTATSHLSTARDSFGATDPKLLAARQAAKKRAMAIAAAEKAAAPSKASAIEAILGSDVTSVTYDDATAMTTTTGTVADVVEVATLERASATSNEIVAEAVKYVGVVPYVHGGATPEEGFDCSGLVQYVYAKFGVPLIHDVDSEAAAGKKIPESKLQPGDLVVYANQHIGIYIGDGYMVDAPDVGRNVEIQAVWGDPYYVRLPHS